MKGATLTLVYIALYRGIYIAIKIYRYEGPQTTLPIDLHRVLYIATIMDRYEGPLTTLT
jgi:hypothetical protein